MHNCVELLGELGYEQEDWDVNGWEGDVWGHYIHYGLDDLEDAPKMWIRAEAYSGELSVGFSGMDDGEEIDTEALKELMRKHWGKYFPVI
jgi:hypothetical protein